MKKFLCSLLASVLVLSLCACGSSPAQGEGPEKTGNPEKETEPAEYASMRTVTYEEGNTSGIFCVLEGAAPRNNRGGNHFYPAEEPIVLLDNEVLKAELLGSFEQKYGPKEDRKQGRGAAILFTNKSQEDLLVDIGDTFLGAQNVTASNLGCPNKCDAGQQVQINFILYTGDYEEAVPVEDRDAVYDLEGKINIKTFLDNDHVSHSRNFPFSASGELTEEPTVPRVKREYAEIKISPNVNHVEKLAEPILLLENEYLKVEIIELFQKKVNWADEKGSRMERGIVVKTTNLHDKKLRVDLRNLYIGQKQIKTCGMDGTILPLPGKAVISGFYLWDHAGLLDENLPDINEIFDLEGIIEVMEYGEEHLENVGEYPFYVS